ncbi:MAG TPA: hypothetical protein VNL77_16690 [Roseiflexaceae bacterium]|nr:hypothetical protein [Roseiflexaceae bacterium]
MITTITTSATTATGELKTIEQVLRASQRGPVLVKTGMDPVYRVVYRKAWYELYGLEWRPWGVRWQNKRTQRVTVLPLDLRPVLLVALRSFLSRDWEVLAEQREQPLATRRQWHPDRDITMALRAGFTRAELGIPDAYTPDSACRYDPEREAFQIHRLWTVGEWTQPYTIVPCV